jgi:glucosamine 6-phosphate synthetase-like amidotransferase/phosphosugar isomerase protein
MKMGTCRDYIEAINRRQINSDREFVLDSLAGAIDRLEKAFPRYGSFLMEFVQNADDAKSRSLRIVVSQNGVIISNDGRLFSKKDVKSICKVGRSSKAARDYIGYLGVGFKAVFLISDRPEIYSGGYHFKFDRTAWRDSEHIPWQVIPLWIDKPTVDLREHSTNFVLPVKYAALVDTLRQEVGPEHLNNRILLFLRSIKKIEMEDPEHNWQRKIEKRRIIKKANYEVYEIEERENDTQKSEERWLVFRSISEVPSYVREDPVTKDWERENVEKREIVVAFKLDIEGNLVRTEKGTAHIGVFSFLPLKEIPSGLHFLLQADFLTAPGRGELARECLWNDWLADETLKMIVQKCIPEFLSNEKWRLNFTDILYSLEGGHELFERHIKLPLNGYLESEAVLIADDNTQAKAEELISVPQEIRQLLTNDDLRILYPNKRIMHGQCKAHPNVRIMKVPEEIHEFVALPESESLLRLKAGKKDIDWFKKLYSMFVDKYSWSHFYGRYHRHNVEHDEFWNRMRGLSRAIILTSDYNLARIAECHVNPKRIRIPQQLKRSLKIVHPQLAQHDKFEEFRRKLNKERHYYSQPDTEVIPELTKEAVRDALKKEQAMEISEKKWKTLPDKERVRRIRELKKLWSTHSVSLRDYDFVTLKDKNGEWIEPGRLLFCNQYKPEHSIESLIGKGLLDLPARFLSPEFIKGINSDDEIREWRRFFEELGVDETVGRQTSRIAQRVGVLTALKYERKNKRIPRELGESERPGYDIESKSRKEERFIEAKGTSDSAYDIFLTVNELRALRDKKDKYFVYVVTDALKEPLLHTVRGTRLLEITDTKIIIPFNKWSSEAKDEEFKP